MLFDVVRMLVDFIDLQRQLMAFLMDDVDDAGDNYWPSFDYCFVTVGKIADKDVLGEPDLRESRQDERSVYQRSL
jgi:hypothetical protein